jgi:hypothetical protein
VEFVFLLLNFVCFTNGIVKIKKENNNSLKPHLKKKKEKEGRKSLGHISQRGME